MTYKGDIYFVPVLYLFSCLYLLACFKFDKGHSIFTY
ncbi:hypothetical protein SLEP1_g27707 [Rubroshorea leprosula]|uniref:Lipoprotein n=1 Tax=Rubroshorea leprosula TaxID=152421 RepID=A0AAV5K217_9ROSI|nr:hypothetical protein SLEP1_g27707 [Rubroshorea leprosula]